MSVEFGATSVDITPSEPLPLAGFSGRPGRPLGVAEPLEANVLSLVSGGVKTHLVSLDLLYGGPVAAQVVALLDEDGHDAFALGSHTHFAPGIDPALPSLGSSSPAYTEFVSQRITSAISSQAYRADVRFSAAAVESSGLFVNRRRPVLGRGISLPRTGRVVMAPNPRGGVDPMVRVVGVVDGGEIAAVLWGVSCHPVCSPSSELTSSCFPGVVRRRIREYLDAPDLPVLFLQGFSGDIRPNSTSRRPPASLKTAAVHLLAGGHRFVDQDPEGFEAWCEQLAQHVFTALDSLRQSAPETGDVMVTRVARQPEGWERPVRLASVRLTQGLRLIIANAEVVHERVEDLARWPGSTLPVGCADEVIGYWPTDRMVWEGGYEGDESRAHFPALDWEAAGGPDLLWRDLLDLLPQHGAPGR